MNPNPGADIAGASETRDILVAGIDEAGRGPVLGPMVVGCCLLPQGQEARLKELGAADSKKLSPQQRDRFLASLKAEPWCIQAVEIIPVKKINEWMAKGRSINLLEVKGFAAALASAVAQWRDRDANRNKPLPAIAIKMDIVGKDASVFSNVVRREFLSKAQLIFPGLRESLKGKPELQVTFESRPKADDIFPVVSAASIVAKCRRDSEVLSLVAKYGLPVGSGYPSDPETISFIRNYISKEGKPPADSRIHWATMKNILSAQKPEIFKTQAAPPVVAKPRDGKRVVSLDTFGSL